MVGRMRYPLPLPDWLARKFDALERPARPSRRRLGRPGQPGQRRALPAARAEPCRAARRRPLLSPSALPRAPADHRLPAGGDHRREPVHRRAGARRPRARPRRASPQVVIEVHGDWRTATRLYGAPSRRFLSPLADAVGRTALRRGDAVRALSPLHRGSGRGGAREPRRRHPSRPTWTSPPSPRRRLLRFRSGRPRSSSGCSRPTRTSTVSLRPGGRSCASCPRRGS